MEGELLEDFFSKTTKSGRIKGDKQNLVSVFSSVMTAATVTSEPVPAVVGIQAKG